MSKKSIPSMCQPSTSRGPSANLKRKPNIDVLVPDLVSRPILSKKTETSQPHRKADPLVIAQAPEELPGCDIRFKKEVIKAGLKRGFKDEKTKFSNESLVLMEWSLRTCVLEMLCRAANQAQLESHGNNPTVETSHLESILPQLMLDI